MANSGVGQFSINVKSNLKDFYGDLKNAQKTMKELTDRKNQLQIDSSQLDKLRDKSQRIAAEMRELRQQKTEIKLGMKDVEDVDKELKNIDQQLASLNRQKIQVDADIQPIRTANVEIYKIDQEIDKLNSKQIKLDAFSVGQSLSSGLNYLSEFSNTLSKISFAPLELGAKAVLNVIEQLFVTAKGLFTELEGDINMEKVFRQNQALMGVDEKKIDSVYKEMDKYADRTVYNQSEMLNTYNALANSGVKDANKLVKGLGAISATAADSSSAMKAMSLQFSQAMINGLQRTDLRIMAEQTNGGLAVAFKQAGKDFEDFQRRLGDANEKSDPGVRDRLANELNEVVLAAAENPAMNKLAETPKTMGQAYETVIESVINKTRKAFMPLQDVGIKWLNKIANDIGGIDSNKIDELGNKLADFTENKLSKVYEFAKNTDFKKLWTEFKDGFSDSFEDLKNHFAPYKALFKSIFNFDLKDMNIYDAANSIGKVVPKLFEYGVKFKEASLLFKGASAGFDVFSKIARYANIKLPAGGLFSKLFGGGSKAAETITAPAINVNVFKTFAKGLGAIAGLSGTIMLGAKALQDVDKIKIGNQLPTKLRNMALAITAMGGFAGAVGGLIMMPGIGAYVGAAEGIGIGVILGLSATLAAAAEAVQTLDGVKINGDYTEKIKTIGEVLGELSIVSGGLLANNLFSIIGNAGAMINDWLKGSQLKSFGKMAETLNEIAKIPEIKSEDIKAKLRSVKDALKILDEGENWHDVPVLSNLLDFFNAISATWEALKDKANASSLKSFAGMLTSLETLGGDFDPDTEKINTNITKIKNALAALDGNKLPNTFLDDATSFIKGLGAKIDVFVKEADADKLKALVSTLTSFETLGTAKINPKKIKSNLKNIKSAIKEINESKIGSLDLMLEQDKKGNIKGLLSTDNTKAISNLGEIVESIKSVMENINSLGGNIEIANIKTNIPLIGDVVSLMNQHLTKDLNDDLMSTKGFKGLSSRITSLKEIMENINSLSGNIEIAAVRTNVQILGDLLSLLNTEFNREMNDDLMKVEGFKGFKSRLESLRDTMGILGDLGTSIPNGGADVRTNIGILSTIFSSMNTFLNKTINDDLMKIEGFKGLKTRLGILKEIMSDLGNLGSSIPNGGADVRTNIGILGTIFNSMNTFINRTINDDLMKVEGVKGLKTRLVTLKEIKGELQDLSQNIPNGGQAVRDNIGVLATIFNSMNTFLNRTINDDLMKVEGFKGLKTRMIVLKEIIGELEGLSQNIPNGGQAIKDNIGVLATIFNSMNTFLNKGINNDLMSIEGFEGLNTRLDILKNMMGKFEGLGANIPNGGQAVKDNIGIILSIFDKIQLGEREFRHLSEMLPIYQKAIEAIGAMTNIIINLNTIPTMPINYDAVYAEIEKVRRLLVQINDLPTPVGLEQIKSLIQEFQNLVNTLNGLEGLFEPVGEGYGRKVIEGFKSVDFEGPATEKVRRLLSKLISMKSSFREAGRQMGQSFGDGFETKLDSIDVSNVGAKIGNQLKTNILNALNGIGTAITEKLNAESGTNRNTTGSSGNSSSGGLDSLPSITLAGGGLVTSATGQAILQDSPEKPLLGNGEYVIPKKIVSALGVPFLEKLRSGQISRTFAGLAQSVSHTTSSVVNNIYHNTNTQNLNLYASGNQDVVLAANRRWRGA